MKVTLAPVSYSQSNQRINNANKPQAFGYIKFNDAPIKPGSSDAYPVIEFIKEFAKNLGGITIGKLEDNKNPRFNYLFNVSKFKGSNIIEKAAGTEKDYILKLGTDRGVIEITPEGLGRELKSSYDTIVAQVLEAIPKFDVKLPAKAATTVPVPAPTPAAA